MPITTVKTIFDSLKCATDITNTLLEIKRLDDVTKVTRDLNRMIVEAQMAAFQMHSEQSALIDAKRELEEKITNLKAFETEKMRYQLKNIGVGGFGYALKESAKNAEPAHYLCTNCCDNGRKSILNPKINIRGFADYYCSNCQSSIPTNNRVTPKAEYA